MLNKYKKLILVLIIVLAGFLRFYNISDNPPSMSWDELALGYNAYSLGIDGKEEFGQFLPVKYLESFGDYKPPVYSYLAVGPVKIFGLNELGVRFPSALFGTLTVLLTYYLVKQLFYAKKNKLKLDIEALALLSAFFLAISPWHIMLSRAAFEANVASFFIVLGTLFFLLGLNRKVYYFLLSAVFFALTFYTFNSSRIFVPLFVISISIFSYKELLKKKKEVFISGIVGFVLIFPLIGFLMSPQASLRFNEVNIFTDLSIIEKSNQKIQENENALWARVVYNRRVGYAGAFAKHYLDHFEPEYLFLTGDFNPRFSVREVGQLYIWDAIFLIIGVVMLLKLRPGRWYFIPLWIILGIIPAATARETPHALRTETIIPTMQILIAFGFLISYKFLKTKTKYAKVIGTMILILLIINFLYFTNVLFGDYATKHAAEWQYGYKEVAIFADSEKNQFKKVYVDEEIGRPYIYNVFFNKLNPEEFRKKAIKEKDDFGFVNIKSIGNIFYIRDFSSIYNKEPNNLFIKSFNNPDSVNSHIPENANIIRVFKLPNGNINFVAYTSKE